MLFSAFLLLLITSSDAGLLRHKRIVGGQPADIKDAPYQVALLYASPGSTQFSQSCGGSIIKANTIISAAHCSKGTTPAQWKIRAGSTYSTSGGQLVDVTKLIQHESYSENTVDNDIALYVLSKALAIDGVTTKIITLPAQNAAVKDGDPAFITGWGSSTENGQPSSSLNKVTTVIVNQKICEDAYKGINTITARMLCAGNYQAGGQAPCRRDSGGPLTVKGVLTGITSWGYNCGVAKYPAVFTRVSSFRTWIDKNY